MNNSFKLIKTHPIFHGLDDDFIKEISKNGIIKQFEENSYINQPGADFVNVCFIISGLVKGGIYSPSGHELTSGRYTDNDVIGIYCLFKNHSLDFFFKAIENTTIFTLKSSYFKELLQKNSVLCYRILQITGESFILSVEKRVDQSFYNAETQIFKFILKLAEEKGKKIGQEILVKHNLTHQDIANYLNSSRQSVTTAFSELKRKNIITVIDRNSFLVKDVEGLHNLCA